jgi:hypothetical protein
MKYLIVAKDNNLYRAFYLYNKQFYPTVYMYRPLSLLQTPDLKLCLNNSLINLRIQLRLFSFVASCNFDSGQSINIISLNDILRSN